MERMAEGLPINPFSVRAWAEIQDVIEAHGRPVIPDAMSDIEEPEVTRSVSLAYRPVQCPTNDGAGPSDLDIAKLRDMRGRDIGGLPSYLSQPQRPDHSEQTVAEGPCNTKGTGTGLYDTDEEDSISSSKARPLRLEERKSGSSAIDLSSAKAVSGEHLERHAPSSLLDTNIPELVLTEAQPEDQQAQSVHRSLLHATISALVPSTLPQIRFLSPLDSLIGPCDFSVIET